MIKKCFSCLNGSDNAGHGQMDKRERTFDADAFKRARVFESQLGYV